MLPCPHRRAAQSIDKAGFDWRERSSDKWVEESEMVLFTLYSNVGRHASRQKCKYVTKHMNSRLPDCKLNFCLKRLKRNVIFNPRLCLKEPSNGISLSKTRAHQPWGARSVCAACKITFVIVFIIPEHISSRIARDMYVCLERNEDRTRQVDLQTRMPKSLHFSGCDILWLPYCSNAREGWWPGNARKDREDTDTQLGFNESVRVHHLHCSTILHTDTDLSCKESVPVYCKQCTLCFECLCAVLVVFVWALHENSQQMPTARKPHIAGRRSTSKCIWFCQLWGDLI